MLAPDTSQKPTSPDRTTRHAIKRLLIAAIEDLDSSIRIDKLAARLLELRCRPESTRRIIHCTVLLEFCKTLTKNDCDGMNARIVQAIVYRLPLQVFLEKASESGFALHWWKGKVLELQRYRLH